MKRFLNIILKISLIIILIIILDLTCIFIINRPLFAIKEDNGDSVNIVYRGIFYDTLNCHEYSTPQIKLKGTKISCATQCVDVGKIIEFVDVTKEINNFACAEALESFYEDNEYIYFWNCMKNQYMMVRYESGYEETISNALKYGTITISDLDNANIEYIKHNK